MCQFLTSFLYSNAQPLGNISDWLYRVEYQQQGSPHIHILIWLKEAPVFGVDDDDLVTDFIDQIIKCQRPVDNPALQKLVNRQIHRHYHTCRKKSNDECHFNYPQPPMRATEIVYALEADMPRNKLKQHKDTWKSIKKLSDDLKEGQCITVFWGTFSQIKSYWKWLSISCEVIGRCSNCIFKKKPKWVKNQQL